MKKKNLPSTTPASNIIMQALCCAQCQAKINVKQQNYTQTVKVVSHNHKDGSTAILDIARVIRITVDNHNCVFEMLVANSPGIIKKFPVRSALSQWAHLAEYGLEQVSRDTIINIAHVYFLKKDRLDVNNLEKSVPVTKSYAERVSKALKFWFNMNHRFSC